jgi:succinyl-CoA synthetase beta subunit
MCKDTTVAGITGQLTHFLIEPFVPHQQSEEFYVCIQSHRYKDEIFFYHEGGVDVGDVDSKASKLAIPPGCDISEERVRLELLSEVDASKQKTLASFIKALFIFYKELHFAYLEINPIAMLPNNKARTGMHHVFFFSDRVASFFDLPAVFSACRLCPWISLQRLTKQLHSCLDPRGLTKAALKFDLPSGNLT